MNSDIPIFIGQCSDGFIMSGMGEKIYFGSIYDEYFPLKLIFFEKFKILVFNSLQIIEIHFLLVFTSSFFNISNQFLNWRMQVYQKVWTRKLIVHKVKNFNIQPPLVFFEIY